MFADDLKVYRVVNSREDIAALQNDLDLICVWCLKNKMILNPTKCQHIKFTRKRTPLTASYHINSALVKEVTSTRDLGVIVDQKLNFREHIDHIVKKGGRLAGFVLRQTKSFKKPEIPIILFNCYVRSLLEYCSPIWNPFYAVHDKRIEAIQKKFFYHLSYANNKCHSLQSYDSRLEHYKATPLSLRRKIADIVFLYKLIHSKIDSPDSLKKINFTIPRTVNPRRNCKTLALPICRTNYAQN